LLFRLLFIFLLSFIAFKGHPLRKVSVTLKNPAKTVLTNALGKYRFDNLAAGTTDTFPGGLSLAAGTKTQLV
jgi:hypothetical protein